MSFSERVKSVKKAVWQHVTMPTFEKSGSKIRSIEEAMICYGEESDKLDTDELVEDRKERVRSVIGNVAVLACTPLVMSTLHGHSFYNAVVNICLATTICGAGGNALANGYIAHQEKNELQARYSSTDIA